MALKFYKCEKCGSVVIKPFDNCGEDGGKMVELTANTEEASLKHVHYYFFIGNDRLCHSHWSRTFLDIWDRMVKGKSQSWAYLQVGSYWGGGTGVDEQTAEKAAQEIISEIAGRQIIWDKIKN